MSPLDYPQTYIDLYAVHQVFLRLGFEPDEIFVAVRDVINLNKKNVLCAVLRTQGKEFIFTLESLGEDFIEREIFAKWTSFVEEISASTQAVKEAVWDKSKLGQDKSFMLGLVAALTQKGFTFPYVGMRTHV